MAMSRRASKNGNQPNLLHSAWYRQHTNAYNVETNPEGIINLGTAENRVIEDILQEKLATINMGDIPEEYTHYCKLSGTDQFRHKLSKFLGNSMESSMKLEKDDIFVMNGCGTVIESIGYSICDENDGVLIPAPYYCGFKSDLEQRIGVKVVPVHLKGSDNFQLTTEHLEDAFLQAEESGIPIKALLLSNPNNPLGNIYTKDELLSYAEFCRSYNIHLIVDEIYMMSVYDHTASFTSVLALEQYEQYKDIIHVVWGFSKDFALSGFRCGVAITKNKDLQSALTSTGYYSSVPTATQYVLEEMITDTEFLDKITSTNHKRLREARDLVCEKLSLYGIPHVFPTAGLFVWVNLSSNLKSNTKAEEINLFNKLMDSGLYLVPGFAFECNEYGWFRIIISRDTQLLNVALERLQKIVCPMFSKVGMKRAAEELADELFVFDHFAKGHIYSRNLRRIASNRI